MLGPVAVAPERQRQGIGNALMKAAIALATSRAQPVICLLGHASYYPRFGFEPARDDRHRTAEAMAGRRTGWPCASRLGAGPARNGPLFAGVSGRLSAH